MADLVRRGKRGLYSIRYTHPVTGHTTYKATGTPRKAEAEKYLKRFYEERTADDLGIPKPGKPVTLQELTDRYLAYASTRLKASSVDARRAFFTAHVMPFFGADTPLPKIDKRWLEKFQTYLLEQGCQPSTVNTYLERLASMFKKAHDWWPHLERTLPVKVARLSVTKKPPKYLTPDQAAHLIETAMARKPDMYHLVCLMYYAGLRLGEALRLRWEDVDFRKQTLLVRERKSHDFIQPPIHPSLQTILKCVPRADRVDTVVKPGFSIKGGNVSNHFKALVRRAGLPEWVTPHVMRHSFATNTLASGASIFDVQGLLGHASVSSTQIYAHHRQDRLRDALNGAKL